MLGSSLNLSTEWQREMHLLKAPIERERTKKKEQKKENGQDKTRVAEILMNSKATSLRNLIVLLSTVHGSLSLTESQNSTAPRKFP